MDTGSYEKLSIRDSAKSLKRYGSTSKHVNKNENYVRHYVSNSDTLQGISLKYNVTIEQIRRANKLWASDSLFLREFLLVPVSEETNSSSTQSTPVVSPTSVQSPESSVHSVLSRDSFDEDNISDFLNKIDAAIASTKEEVKKTSSHSEFISENDFKTDRRKPAVSRMKQLVNNNSASDLSYAQPQQTVVIQQGKKVRTSIEHHEQQQDQLFEL